MNRGIERTLALSTACAREPEDASAATSASDAGAPSVQPYTVEFVAEDGSTSAFRQHGSP